MIEHEGVTMCLIHGVMERGPWRQPIQSYELPGVVGVGHMIDGRKERSLSVEMIDRSFASYEALEDAMAEYDDQNGTLTGTINMSGELEATFQNCTFVGATYDKIKWDPNWEYYVRATLHWIQRSPER